MGRPKYLERTTATRTLFLIGILRKILLGLLWYTGIDE